jgi:hypothetical protein
MGEIELQTTLNGYQGNWRLGGSSGTIPEAGSVKSFHISVDQWLSPRTGIFGRYGFNDSSAASLAFGPVRQSYSGGGQRRFIDREDRVSAWSVGFSQAFGIPTDQPRASERVIETYYRWQWTRNASITPDFQLLFGAGGRKSKGVQAVMAVRLNFGF